MQIDAANKRCWKQREMQLLQALQYTCDMSRHMYPSTSVRTPPRWLLHPGLLEAKMILPLESQITKHHISPTHFQFPFTLSLVLLIPVQDSINFMTSFALSLLTRSRQFLANLKHWQLPANPWGSYTEKSNAMVHNHWHYQPLPKSTFD